MKNKKGLIFSFAYYPYVGGAEVAIKEITDRLTDIEFDLITYNLGGEPDEEKIGNTYVYRLSASTKYLYPFKAFMKGLSLHRKNNYHAFWSMMANTGFPAIFLKLFFPKLRYVLTIQEGDPIPQIKKRVWFVYPFFKMVFRRADHVTALSKYLAEFAKSMGSADVEVVPNGVDLGKFRLTSDRSALSDKSRIVLVTTSRLVKKNAVDDIIRSLQFLPDNVIFRCIGSGKDEAHLKALVAELKLEDRVEFYPHMDHSVMSTALKEADIFIRPSLTEGLGSSFIEAMAAGLPVIATPVGGIPDFLKDGETGLFCQVREPKSIADNVTRLIKDPGLYTKISRNSVRLASESYDWNKIAERFREIFINKI
jgi:glycosyltransferase involved in cell wall biosynthesis